MLKDQGVADQVFHSQGMTDDLKTVIHKYAAVQPSDILSILVSLSDFGEFEKMMSVTTFKAMLIAIKGLV